MENENIIEMEVIETEKPEEEGIFKKAWKRPIVKVLTIGGGALALFLLGMAKGASNAKNADTDREWTEPGLLEENSDSADYPTED